MLTRFCSFRLDTTCVVLGWLGAMSSFVGVVLCSVAISMARQLAEAIINGQEKLPYTEEEIQSFITVAGAIYLVLALINLVTSFCLILGTIKKRHLLLVPWLTNSLIFLVILTIQIVGTIISQIAMHTPPISVLFLSIFGVGILAFNFYIWYAVYSHYKELQASPDQRHLLTGTVSPSYTKM